MDDNYDLVIAKAKAFRANSYSDVLYNIGDFAREVPGRVILGVNIENNYDSEEYAVTAYVMYEG
jgi:cytidine deaminase